MKATISSSIILAFIGVGFAIAAPPAGSGPSLFPSSPAAQKSCTVDITPWFMGGQVTPNGPVMPANSITFQDNTNCNFYQWSWQMFLWSTTPTGRDNGLVFNSAPFFDFDIATGTLVAESNLSVRSDKPSDDTKQATGNALVWDDDNLVYYAIHTNDVWAFFTDLNSLTKTLSPPATQFPTDAASVKPVITGAFNTYNVQLNDARTLTMEIKTSWVDAATVPDASDYITIEGVVPTYDMSNPSMWTPGAPQTLKLALVGIHIVGSVNKHPEMVWATFEHKNNAPNDTFTYLDQNGNANTYANFDADNNALGDWLLMPAGTNKSAVPINTATGQEGNIVASNAVNNGAIVGLPAGTAIEGQYVFRQSPWGLGEGQSTPPSESNAQNVTDLISINQSVLSQLADGDLRANYFLVGATWTNGIIPDQDQTSPQTPQPPTNGAIIKGSQNLANTTMETFIQPQNCFSCHNGGNLGGLSHIYNRVKTFDPSSVFPNAKKK